jgi:hypothetical protein
LNVLCPAHGFKYRIAPKNWLGLVFTENKKMDDF